MKKVIEFLISTEDKEKDTLKNIKKWKALQSLVGWMIMIIALFFKFYLNPSSEREL